MRGLCYANVNTPEVAKTSGAFRLKKENLLGKARMFDSGYSVSQILFIIAELGRKDDAVGR